MSRRAGEGTGASSGGRLRGAYRPIRLFTGDARPADEGRVRNCASGSHAGPSGNSEGNWSTGAGTQR
eukprot:10894545-Alexandrium_andersonii.AAC.1